MKRVHVTTCTILVLLLVSVSTAAQQRRSVSERSYQGARRILDRAIKALGGIEKFRLVEDISIKYEMKAFELGQSANPEAPLDVRREEGIRVIDLREKRSYRELKTNYRGDTLNWRRQVLNDKSGFTIDLVANVAYPIATAALPGNARGVQRWLPHLLIQTALTRAGTLRLLGSEHHKGRAQQVISFADVVGAQIALYFDARSDLLTQYEVLGDDPVLGDVLSAVSFSDYRDVQGLKVPFKTTAKYGGEILWDQSFIEVKINTRPADELFEIPKGATTGPETYGALTPTLTKLAPDVYFVNGISGGEVWFYSQMFVVFKDYVVVLESPLHDGISQAIITKIKEVAPNKPIKYLVPTHYHFDHLGGVRAYIAKGATIVTTPGNRTLIEKIATAAHTIRPDSLSLNQRKVAIETFTDKKVITDGQQTVELYNLGPTPHVDEIVLVYLPKEKIIFVSDLMMTRITGPFTPVSATDLDFAQKLRQLDLKVETVANGHGWIGKMDDFVKFLGQDDNPQTSNPAEPQKPLVSFNSGKGRSLSSKGRIVSQENPTIVIDVSNELRSLGVINFPLKKVAQVERFIFGRSDKNGKAQRLFIAQFESILPGIKGAYSFPMTNPTRIGSHDYQTQVGFFNFAQTIAANPGAEAEQTKVYLNCHGVQVDDDFLVARYARIASKDKRHELILFYLENLRDLNLTRSELEQGGSRSSEREKIFAEFAARAQQSFKVFADGKS